MSDGVDCDSRNQAAPNIYAAGDVAGWYHVGMGKRIRLENQQNAVEQGVAVGDSILGNGYDFTPIRYGWSSQYGVQIQMLGIFDSADRSALLPSAEPGRFAVVFEKNGKVSGALGWNAAGQIRRVRRLIAENTPWQEIDSVPVPDASDLCHT
jgi:NADPH-dependent 2,4-dienoyl-CoA reductase/sulfur reductase-like enzyme